MVEREVALRHLDGVAAQVVQFVPAVDVEGVVFIFAIFGATPVPKKLVQKFMQYKVIEPIAMLILVLLVTAYLVDGSFNPFLYFRF